MVTAEKPHVPCSSEASELGNTLREIVRRDLADETRRFNDTLNQRIQLASDAIVQAVRAKEAIAAGATAISGKWKKRTEDIQKTTTSKNSGAFFNQH